MTDTPGSQVAQDQPADGAGSHQSPKVTDRSQPPTGSGFGAIVIDPQVVGAVIAQAAAIFAVAVGIIYAAGALLVAFKLWYDGVPTLPVLVQLPRTWFISQALTELLPIVIIVGVLTVWAWNRLSHHKTARRLAEPAAGGPDSAHREASKWRWLASVVVALTFTGLALVVARYVWIGPIPAAGQDQSRGGVFPRPWWNILILCLVLDSIAIRIALHCAARKPVKPRWMKNVSVNVFRAVVVSIAFVPIVASASEAWAFPLVKVCGQAFSNPGTAGRRFAFGNLIGVSGQYVYIAEVLTKEPRPNHYIFAAGYVAVIPLSEAQLVAIGRNASCGQLVGQTAHP